MISRSILHMVGQDVSLEPKKGRRYSGSCPVGEGHSLDVYPYQDRFVCIECGVGGGLDEYLAWRNKISTYKSDQINQDPKGIVDGQEDCKSWYSLLIESGLNDSFYTHDMAVTDFRNIFSNLGRRVQPRFGSDSKPRLGNLAYPKRALRTRTLEVGRSGCEVGQVLALLPNLQPHLVLQHPSGTRTIVDTERYIDGGSLDTTVEGMLAVCKNLISGEHSPLPVKAISNRGLCLLKLPGLEHEVLMPPRAPLETGASNRQVSFYGSDGGLNQWAIESIIVKSSFSYRDLSGFMVNLVSSSWQDGYDESSLI